MQQVLVEHLRNQLPRPVNHCTTHTLFHYSILLFSLKDDGGTVSVFVAEGVSTPSLHQVLNCKPNHWRQIMPELAPLGVLDLLNFKLNFMQVLIDILIALQW